MKKTYTTPILAISGDIVNETLKGATPLPESDNPEVNMIPIPGSIGYYL